MNSKYTQKIQFVRFFPFLLMLFLGVACGGGGDNTEGQTGTNSETPGTPPPSDSKLVSIQVSDVAVPADYAAPLFTVTLSSAASSNVSVAYATRDDTAVAGTDYVQGSGVLEFLPGETTKHVQIELLKQTFTEQLSFELVLSNPENAELVDAVGVATLAASTPGVIMKQESVFNPDWDDVAVFSNAGTCASCHKASDQAPGVMTFAGEDISPATQWQHSMMAQSMNDPYYQAVVEDEARTFPALAGFIENKCLTCHTPMAHTHAHQTQTSLDVDGFYRLETAANQMHAREGISCTVCHQIQDDGKLGTAESFSGNFSISESKREIYGPYANPVGQAMQNNTQYTPVQSAHMSSSAHCATCHNLHTPTISVNDGQPTGGMFPEQTPYMEWQNSIYVDGGSAAKSCQQCHMAVPAENYQTQIATRPNGSANSNWPERTPFQTHEFTGANTHTLQLLKNYRDVLGIENSTTESGFDKKISQTKKLLRTAADIQIGTTSVAANQLDIPVTITNKTGHKLPTSYPSRRVWVHLLVNNASDQVIFESGKPDSNGYLSTDAKHLQKECLSVNKNSIQFDFSQCYEPHHNFVNSAEQIAIYEPVLGDVNGNIAYVLLHADHYLKDNRIPPKGFARSRVPENADTAILGSAISDTDFSPETNTAGSGQDTVHYKINVSGQTGSFSIQANLYYQAVRPAFVYGLQSSGSPRVDRYKQMYTEVPPTVELLASDVVQH